MVLQARLSIKNLWHKYTSVSTQDWSLQSVNLELNNGELIGLIGPSGCGKTTFLRLIAGFENPYKGSILINGREVASSSLSIPPEERGIGMVFQDFALFPHLNTWDNVTFGINKSESYCRAEWLLDLLGISELRTRFPHELSGGQKQRLALARALAPAPSLILLDEPFSSLDIEVRYRLRSELLEVLTSCATSAILVSHDPQEALAICNKVAVMSGGQLHQCSEPRDLVEKPLSSFVGRFVLQRNVIPLKNNGSYLNTPIGTLLVPSHLSSFSFSELLIDEKGILVLDDPNGAAKVVGSEFQGYYYILRILFKNLVYRVYQDLDSTLNVGDRCTLSFKSNNNILLFPGSFKCKTEL